MSSACQAFDSDEAGLFAPINQPKFLQIKQFCVSDGITPHTHQHPAPASPQCQVSDSGRPTRGIAAF
jgi:hypothetical protein